MNLTKHACPTSRDFFAWEVLLFISSTTQNGIQLCQGEEPFRLDYLVMQKPATFPLRMSHLRQQLRSKVTFPVKVPPYYS